MISLFSELFNRRAILLNAWAIVCGSSVFYQDFPIWTEYSAFDANGRYYASVMIREGKVLATIAERKPGTQPSKPADSRYDRKVAGTRKGDVELGRCKLEEPPNDLLVSSTGLGVVAIDPWWRNQTDFDGTTKNALIVVSNQGEIRFRKNLDDLFGKEKAILMQIPQWRLGDLRVEWYLGGWIDEKAREVFIAWRGSEMLVAVSFDTGRVRRGKPEDIYRAVAEAYATGDTFKLERSLPRLAEIGSKSKKAFQLLSALVTDQKVSLENRLMAGLPLAESGDKAAADLFISTAMGPQDSYDNSYAIKHLQDALGDGALPLLGKLIQENHGRMEFRVQQALVRFGEKAVPMLIKMLDNHKNVGGVYDALDSLFMMGPKAKAAVPSLLRELHNKTHVEESLSSRNDVLAARALGAIGPAARVALPTMIEINHHADTELRQALVEAIEQILKKRVDEKDSR